MDEEHVKLLDCDALSNGDSATEVSDDTAAAALRHAHRHKPKRRCLKWLRKHWRTPFLLLLLLAAIGGGALLGHGMAHTARPPAELVSLGNCGSTAAEGRERGCLYDLMHGTWIHPRCYDKDLGDRYLQYLRDINTTYYAEEAAITVVPEEVVLRGEHDILYTSGGFHHLHCSYIWEKQWRAMQADPPVLDSESRDEEHTMHCIFLNSHPLPWELELKNATRVYSPEKPVECIIG